MGPAIRWPTSAVQSLPFCRQWCESGVFSAYSAPSCTVLVGDPVAHFEAVEAKRRAAKEAEAAQARPCDDGLALRLMARPRIHGLMRLVATCSEGRL